MHIRMSTKANLHFLTMKDVDTQPYDIGNAVFEALGGIMVDESLPPEKECSVVFDRLYPQS